MNFLIAPDSFKGSLSATDAAQAIQTGLQVALPTSHFTQLPMADGGEGTVAALVTANQGQFIHTQATGPNGTPVNATYGLIDDQRTAVIEVAAASGLTLSQLPYTPLTATSRGTGELIVDALDRGVETIIIGLGGSATNDGGAGLLQALGVHLWDRHHSELAAGGGALRELVKIDADNIDPRLRHTTLIIASDVTNPLVGTNGASAVFGPQKGADKAMVRQLDANLTHFGTLIGQLVGHDVLQLPGGGAAGGIGMALLAMTSATMHAGTDIVLQANHFSDYAVNADFVITGEGQIDFQTKFGKTPYGVAQAAKQANPTTTVLALAGNVGSGIDSLYDAIDAAFPIIPGVCTLPEAIDQAGPNLMRTATNLGRLIARSQSQR